MGATEEKGAALVNKKQVLDWVSFGGKNEGVWVF